MKRITDLEKFALEHIVRPYQETGGFGEKTVTKLPCGIDEICTMLKTDSEWSRLVLDRIRGIGFRFPNYIKHDLVQIIKDLYVIHNKKG